MEFKKEDLKDCVYGDSSLLLSVEDNIVDNDRWSIFHSLVFKDIKSNKLYRTSYSVGATENQDEEPFEYDKDMVFCQEVEPKEVVVIEYVSVKNKGE